MATSPPVPAKLVDHASVTVPGRLPGSTEARPEVSGREGPDPVRYGDWENNGIASDF